MPRLLELFSGTGSIGKIFRARGWEVVSVDCDPKMNPTIVADIATFNYRMLGGRFDALWASPPCQMYSIARSKAKTPRDLEGSDRLVQKVKDMIDFFHPTFWVFENPQSGLLKGRRVVEGIPYVDVDYCMYSWPYRKRTRIWTNATGQRWTRLCEHDCEASDGNCHTNWAQKAGQHRGDKFTREELYAMPPLLCEEIYSATCGIIRLSRLA